jgi:hypothetical protein
MFHDSSKPRPQAMNSHWHHTALLHRRLVCLVILQPLRLYAALRDAAEGHH